MGAQLFRNAAVLTAADLEVKDDGESENSSTVLSLAANQVPWFVETWYSTPATGLAPVVNAGFVNANFKTGLYLTTKPAPPSEVVYQIQLPLRTAECERVSLLVSSETGLWTP